MSPALTTAAMTVATQGPHGGPGWGHTAWWPIFPIVWLLFWVAIIVTAILLVRRNRRERPTRAALTVLGEEFARGNITEEEYEQRLAVLRRLGGQQR